MNYKSIDVNTPLASQPDKLLINLKKHQLATLYEAQKLEKNEIIFDNGNYYAKSNIGVLANRQGSGNSFIILSIFDNNNIFYKEHRLIHYSPVYECYEKNDIYGENNFINTNLIITPKYLVHQWENIIKTYTTYSYKMINNSTDINVSVEYSEQPDIILITNTMYPKFIKQLNKLYTNIIFKRIVFDEADILNVPNENYISAKFYWFISHRIENLQKPYVEYRYMENNRLVKLHGISISGFIKDIFESIKDIQGNHLLYLRCEDDFICFPNMKIKMKDIVIKNRLISVLNNNGRQNDITNDIFNMIDKSYISNIVYDKDEESDICPIGYERIENCATVSCCKNSFELQNIINWLYINKTCPICRNIIDINKIDVRMKDNVSITKTSVILNIIKNIRIKIFLYIQRTNI